jgi:hypothetical protein
MKTFVNVSRIVPDKMLRCKRNAERRVGDWMMNTLTQRHEEPGFFFAPWRESL